MPHKKALKIEYTKYITPDALFKFLNTHFSSKNFIKDLPDDAQHAIDKNLFRNLPKDKYNTYLNTWATSVIELFIERWINRPNIPYFKLLKPLLDKLRAKDIFLPSTALKYIYRGTTMTPAIEKLIEKSSLSDWKNFDGFMIYVGKSITYTPHKHPQSWSTKSTVAARFGGQVVIGTTVNREDCYFDPTIINSFNLYPEHEIIVDNTKYKSFLMVATDAWQRLTSGKSTSGKSANKAFMNKNIEPMFKGIK